MAHRIPTVLIVDDEADIVFLLRLWLESDGYRVLEAETGEDALIVLADECPDLVMLDLQLPGIDGWTLLDRIRADAGLQSIPVLIASASTGVSASGRAAEQGCAYVSKPFTPDSLLQAVSAALEQVTLVRLITARIA